MLIDMLPYESVHAFADRICGRPLQVPSSISDGMVDASLGGATSGVTVTRFGGSARQAADPKQIAANITHGGGNPVETPSGISTDMSNAPRFLQGGQNYPQLAGLSPNLLLLAAQNKKLSFGTAGTGFWIDVNRCCRGQPSDLGDHAQQLERHRAACQGQRSGAASADRPSHPSRREVHRWSTTRRLARVHPLRRRRRGADVESLKG